MGKQPPSRQQVAGILTAIAVLLGGGTGAGYVLHGSSAGAAELPPMERVVALEQWRAAREAAREAVEKRDADERQALKEALRDMNATNAGLREAVVALTERMGSIVANQTETGERLRAIEMGFVRPASGKR